MRTYQLIQIGLTFLEAAAFITGLFYWNKVKTSYWKWFVVYLGAIVLGEAAGLLLLYKFREPVISRNLYIYFIIPMEFLFFLWLYGRYYAGKKAAYLIFAAMGLYLVVFLVNVIFLPGTTIWFFPISYLLGVVLLLLLSVIFFLQLISSDAILGYRKEMIFWVSLGLLVFYLVSSPYFGLKQLLYDKYRGIFWIYYYIQLGCNYLMYLFFCCAFIWGQPR